MKRITMLLCLAMLWGAIGSQPARASWVANNCYEYSFDTAAITRSDAYAYAIKAKGEGYEWGGGCWDDDNKDDTPGAPDSNGEGPDCSGFVFKSWYLKNGLGKDGFHKWDKLQNIHGPYSTYTYYDPIPDYPFSRLPNKNRDTTKFMDAFVKQGHMGLLETSANPSANTDWILEALGDVYGTGTFEQDYRKDSRYRAIARKGWKAEPCDPYCGKAEGATVRVP